MSREVRASQSLLSAPRRAEKRTRLRSQWTAPNGMVERYFDYVLKKVVPGTGEQGSTLLVTLVPRARPATRCATWPVLAPMPGQGRRTPPC